jgi:type I restriction enzyme, S subunit
MTGPIQKKKVAGGLKFRNDDVLIARITPCLENGKTCLVTLLDDEVGFGSTEFIVLRGKNRVLSSFGALLARSEQFRKYAIINMTGTSGRKRIDSKILETFSLPIPPDMLLEKFENIISTNFKKETTNTLENIKLIKLRDWLIPMLMNGQVSVLD